ncbi:MAG: sugar phosphate isomerase/epimerase [Planctomycetes bacterium]|nr:sugar phosphate isomerase/epimerase [Planctomycetota bacterium]
MKIGFSSLVCPGWDLDKIVAKAAEYGFDGVELHGICGEDPSPWEALLATDPTGIGQLFRQHNVELVCLSTSATLDACSRRTVEQQIAVVGECLATAAKVGCPFVRIPAGQVQEFDNQRFVRSRVADAVRELVPLAVQYNVTLLIENGGDLADSESVWFIADAAAHPAVQICWNQCHALTVGERSTVSIPRLASKIGLVHVCDAEFDGQGLLTQYAIPGQGYVEIAAEIDLLKGLLYDGYLVFEWPKPWTQSLPTPDDILPKVAQFLRDRIAAEQNVLTAYKTDKNRPRLAARSPVASSGS